MKLANTRTCRGCAQPLSGHFNARYCSDPCKSIARREAARRWREAHRELANERTAIWNEANRNRELSKGRLYAYRIAIEKHGITVERFNELARNGCWICKTDEPGGTGRWHIDHDHRCCPGSYSCGKCIRGILCARCNVGLAMLGDSLANVERAASYLRAHEVHNPPMWLQELKRTGS